VTVSLPHHPHRSPSCHVAKWSLCIFPYWMPQGEQIQDGYLPFEAASVVIRVRYLRATDQNQTSVPASAEEVARRPLDALP
jgi:hypothetical protein